MSKFTYSSYLKLSELLSLQQTVSKPVAPDEPLFIVTHQAYELWFKIVIQELKSLHVTLPQSDFRKSLKSLERLERIFELMIKQLTVLETMTARDYSEFRNHLGSSSGFQSLQFRLIELAIGADPNDYEWLAKEEPEWKKAVAEFKDKPNLREAFFLYLQKKGYLAAKTPDEVVNAVVEVYRDDTDGESLVLCEKILSLDELLSAWRFRHAQMVERIIGMSRGTGGSLGVPYLQSTIKKRYFPELWDARTKMLQ